MDKKYSFIGFGLGVSIILGNLIEMLLKGLLFFRPGLILISMLLCFFSFFGIVKWMIAKEV